MSALFEKKEASAKSRGFRRRVHIHRTCMMSNDIPFDTLITVFGSLLTIIGGLLLYIFGAMNKKIDRIESTIAEMQEANAQDHAEVGRCLARLEEGMRSQDKDIQRHERRLDELEGREE